jgi:hypothetical protein
MFQCEDRIGTGPPWARTEAIYVDLNIGLYSSVLRFREILKGTHVNYTRSGVDKASVALDPSSSSSLLLSSLGLSGTKVYEP